MRTEADTIFALRVSLDAKEHLADITSEQTIRHNSHVRDWVFRDGSRLRRVGETLGVMPYNYKGRDKNA